MTLNIAVAHFQALGDTVRSTVALRMIRRSLPNARLSVFTREYASSILSNNPDVDVIRVVPSSAFRIPGLLTCLPRHIFSWLEKKYDVCVSFHCGLLPNLLIATIPCVNRITPRKKGLRGFLSSNGRAFTTAKNAYTQIYPAIAREAIKAVGGLPSPVVPRAVLSPSKQGRDNARRILKECNITEGKFVAVLPGGGTNPGQNTNVKQYPRMDEAVALFQQKHPEIPVCLLGDKNDREACQKVKAGVAKGNLCIDLHGKTDLETLVALIQSAQAVLCNDSGPLHIAMALNIPTVAVFGPTVPQFVLDPRAPVWGVRQITKSGYSGKFRGNEKEAVDTFAKLRPEMVAVKLQKALDVYSIGHKN